MTAVRGIGDADARRRERKACTRKKARVARDTCNRDGLNENGRGGDHGYGDGVSGDHPDGDGLNRDRDGRDGTKMVAMGTRCHAPA